MARQDVLLPLLEQLQSALAARAPGREREWAGEVDALLSRLQEALRLHVADTDTPTTGMFARVDLTRPSLVRQVGTLRQEHTEFLERAETLRGEVQAAARAFDPQPDVAPPGRLPGPAPTDTMPPDFGSLRQRLEQFATALKQHRDGEAALVLESVTTDIGVGD